jgi:hypothetical protein
MRGTSLSTTYKRCNLRHIFVKFLDFIGSQLCAFSARNRPAELAALRHVFFFHILGIVIV